MHALTLGANVTASGAVFAADTTNLGVHTLTADTTFGMGAITGQTLTSTVTDATHYGNVAATGNATVALGSKVNLTIGAVPSATTIYTLVFGARLAGSVIALGSVEAATKSNGVTDIGAARTLTAGLVTYSQITTGTGAPELEIEAARGNISTLGSTITANDASVDAALNTIGTTGSTAVTTAVNNVATAHKHIGCSQLITLPSPCNRQALTAVQMRLSWASARKCRRPSSSTRRLHCLREPP